MIQNRDNFEDEINREIQAGFIKQIADKIVQGMLSLENATEDVKRRWIWELLQNAKDVPNKYGGVTVKVELFPNNLIFSHNGDCFTIKNLTSLIQQVSSKDDKGQDENVTGKFGTGFITTHLLSKEFTIRGVAKSETGCCKRFEMKIDRNADNSADMTVRINTALEKLRELKNEKVAFDYENSRKESDMDTSFEYPLDQDTYQYAKIGCKDLIKVVPYTLIFIPLIKEVTVNIHTDGKTKSYTVKRNGNITHKGIEYPEVVAIKEKTLSKSIQNNYSKDVVTKEFNDSTKYHFIMNSKGRVNVVWPLNIVDNVKHIVRVPIKLPKLFCSFPLIGSEQFMQPMIINCGGFYPNEPRNTIFLKNEKSHQVIANRNYLLEANKLFFELLDHSISNKFVDFYNLFVGVPIDNPFISLKWIMDEVYRPRINTLVKEPIVKTQNGMKAITSMFIPKAPTPELRRMLWELYYKYFHGSIVLKEELEAWYAVLYESTYAKDIEKFVKDFSELGNLNNIQYLPNYEEKISFINEMISFLRQSSDTNDKKSNNNYLLSRYACIPNQNGEFKREKELRTDKNSPIPKEIKNIYKELKDKDMNDFLIDHQIKRDLSDYQKYDSYQATVEINEKLRNTFDPDIRTPIAIKMTALTDSHNSKEREIIIGFLNDCKAEITEQKLDIKLPDIFYDVSDKIIFEYMVKVIEGPEAQRKNTNPRLLSNFANNCLSPRVTNPLAWMNDFINFLLQKMPQLVNSHKIIPNQSLSFALLKDLYVDEGIPDSIKNILSNSDCDLCSILLNKSITCFPGHQKMDLMKVKNEINGLLGVPMKRGYRVSITKKPEEIYPTAVKLIGLYSQETHEKDSKLVDILNHVNFNSLINTHTIKIHKEEVSDDVLNHISECMINAKRFFIELLLKRIREFEKLNQLNEILSSDYQSFDLMKKWYIDIMKYASDSDLFMIEMKGYKLYINQNSYFCSKEDVHVAKTINQELLDIAENSPIINKKWTNSFLDPLLNEIHSKYTTSSNEISDKDVAKDIDDKIRDYDGSKQSADFRNLVLRLRNLIDINNFNKELLPYFSQNKDSIIVNTLSSNQLAAIAELDSSGKSCFLEIANKMDKTVLETLSRNPQLLQAIMQNPQALNNYTSNLSSQQTIRPIHHINLIRPRRNHRIWADPYAVQRREYIPPPPPPPTYQQKLTNCLNQVFCELFEEKIADEKDKNSFLCKVIKTSLEDESQENNEYRIICMTPDHEGNVFLSTMLLEYIIDNDDSFVIFVVPREHEFNESRFTGDLLILTKLSEDLAPFYSGYEQLIGAENEKIECTTDKLALILKKQYIQEIGQSLAEWKETLPKNHTMNNQE
ncbi:hypothetical protein TRFO_09859 [Tritrichomonas foetus]|uniref:Uncharacterized protein n=1 Tax=Tritrichomonas foetus TaxID=1144522 RepID=A0A1J4JBY1_9EUKA|nr:hypothetical protein TRFO_09859 [Tritrichomonas foetus]|eukprot:OHS96694.1 hypothetical protein TRFO_09859 [Tritrichomonas foetus]